MSEDKLIHCSFCGRSEAECKHLITGKDGVHIRFFRWASSGDWGHQKGSSADPFPFRSGALGEYRLQDRARFAGGRECVHR